MQNDDKLDGSIQENVLTLLVFDDEACKTIRATIQTAKVFESAVFREVASQAIDYIDQFGCAPKEHIADTLEDILNGSDKRRATSYKRLLESLFTGKDSVNRDYVIAQLHKFVRAQTFKAGIVNAIAAMEDGRIDDAEVAMQKALSAQVVSFEMGTLFNDARQSTKFLDIEDQHIRVGIKEMDDNGIGLYPGEQLALMAPSGVGKSWGLVHIGKWALLQRKTVLHVTLEMSEARVAQRYAQSFFAISNRHKKVRLPVLEKDKSGVMSDVFWDDVERATMLDPNIRTLLGQRIGREFRKRRPLIIKQFPTGLLTVSALDAYLDSLERFHKIVPDVVIIDYPGLMKIDTSDKRIAIGEAVKDLRGQAVRRNYAQVVADQANREGAKARLVDATHAAEDWSKVATADTIFTLSQTAMEKKLGLMRLLAAKARNEASGIVTLLTQAYQIGQFALDSARLGDSDYWSFISGAKPDEPDAD